MDLLRLNPSELQHWGNSLKGNSGMQGGTEVSNIKVKAGVGRVEGGQLSSRQKDG